MIRDMPRPRPPHLHREVSRHGRVTWYVRPHGGKRIRLRAEYGTDAFWSEYQAGLTGKRPAVTGKASGTLAWLISCYVESAEWAAFSSATRKQRHAQLRLVERLSGHRRIKDVTRADILAGRDKRRDRPHAANNFLKAMRGLFGWAVVRDPGTVDPTQGVKLLAGPNDAAGFHAWTEDELTRFEARWPVGSRQRLAYDLLLFTGLRRGDAVRLGRQHIRNGELSIRTEKTGAVVTRPILAPLATSIAATKTGDLAFLVTERGEPFGKESFGTWFGKACRAAGVPGSAHGLRKAGARRAAEAGATEAQLNALYGWAPGSRESAVYTRTADNARLARSAPVLPHPSTRVRARKGKMQ